MNSMMDMTEHHLALATGAGRGIGRAIAKRLARQGIPVVLVARSSEEVTAVRQEIMSAGGRAYACPCDITSSEEVAALAADITQDLGPLTLLVNNAGIAPSMKLEDTSDEVWRSTFSVNVDGPFYLLRAFLPAMREAKHTSHVISIASTAAQQGYRFTAAYTASKHAMLGLMRAATEELFATPILFSTLCPGFTRTSLIEASIAKQLERGKTRAEAEAAFGKMNREGRLIEPEEIAETVLRLYTTNGLTSGGVYDAAGTPVSAA